MYTEEPLLRWLKDYCRTIGRLLLINLLGIHTLYKHVACSFWVLRQNLQPVAPNQRKSPIPLPSTRSSMPEFIDPVFAKTSQHARFLLSENERFGLVFVKTGSINSGTSLYISVTITSPSSGGGILGQNPDRNLKSFPPWYSQTPWHLN